VVFRFLQQPFNIATGHELRNDIGLPRGLFADIKHGNDVGMVAELTHRLGFAGDPAQSFLVQALGLDEGKRDVAIEAGVMSQIDLLLTTLAQEAFYLIAAVGERAGFGLCGWGSGADSADRGIRLAGSAFGRGKVVAGVSVLRV